MATRATAEEDGDSAEGASADWEGSAAAGLEVLGAAAEWDSAAAVLAGVGSGEVSDWAAARMGLVPMGRAACCCTMTL